MDQVQQVREKTDIVGLIEEYIPLKQMGRNFKSRCPFHQEKSPSFVVSPERQIWHCFGCFPPGAKIKTPFGYHNIEEIDKSHWVLSGKGNLKRVNAVMTHQYSGDLVSIVTRKLGGSVCLTSDHNVFVLRGAPYTKKYKDFSKRYKKYLSLRVTDKVKYDRLITKYFPILLFPAGKLQIGDLLLYPIRRVEKDLDVIDLSNYLNKFTKFGPIPRDIPLQIPLNDSLLKLIGYYIAEGSSHRAYVRFSLGSHELVFAQEILSLAKEIFNLDGKMHVRSSLNRTGIEVTICHSKLGNIFEILCGKQAKNKHIPFILQDLPPQRQRVLIDAIFKGDGHSFLPHRSNKVHKSITTVSQVLSEQIIDMLLRLNYFPTMCIEKAKTDKRSVKHQAVYVIFWSEQAQQKYTSIYYHPSGDEFWLLPIKKISKDAYRGPVYNFTVDDDHSYMTTNFAVANCGKGGDAFNFVMEYERMDFAEALSVLAKRAGVTLKPLSPQEHGIAAKKERLYQMNHLALEFYHYVLTKHKAGKQTLSYLEKRGVTPKLITTFELGYAPTTGTALCDFLRKKQFSKDEILSAGLAYERGGDLRDFFMGRLIFPLVDHYDNVVGFSGRGLTDAVQPKYVNTKETIVYHKGSHVFGLSQTKKEIRVKNQVIVVEGEFDALSLFQTGVGNVVAIKGTALTGDQVRLLSRFAKKITLCLDQDNAGQKAVMRSLPILEKHGVTTTIITLPLGQDPDEAVKMDEYAFKKAVKQDLDAYDVVLSDLAKSLNISTAEGKKTMISTLLPLFNAIQNEIIKEHYLRKLSETLSVSLESVMRETDKLTRPEKLRVIQVASNKRPRQETMEEYLLSLLVQDEDHIQINVQKALPKLGTYVFSLSGFGRLFKLLTAYAGGSGSFAFSKTIPEELSSVYNTCFLLPLPSFASTEKHQEEVERVAKTLRTMFVRKQLEVLSKTLAGAPPESPESRVLQEEYQLLTQQLKNKS